MSSSPPSSASEDGDAIPALDDEEGLFKDCIDTEVIGKHKGRLPVQMLNLMRKLKGSGSVAESQKARLTGFVLVCGLLLSLYLRYFIYPYRGRGLTGLPAKELKLQACQMTFNDIPVFN